MNLADWLHYMQDSIFVKGLLSIFSTIFIALFGTPDLAFQAFVTLLIIDLVTKAVKIVYDSGGIKRALTTKNLNSHVASRRTLYKMFRYFVILACANQLGMMIPKGVEYMGYSVQFLIRVASYIYVGWSEIISIFETLVGIDGHDVEVLAKATKSAKRRVLDRILDRILDMLEERLLGRPRNGGNNNGS